MTNDPSAAARPARAVAAYLVVAGAVLLADQATKIAAHATLPGRGPLVVIPRFFNLTYSRNAGGLFGFLRDLPDPWRLLLLTVLPLGAVALIALFLVRTDPADRRTRAALALILGGAAGNLVDRIVRGEVVDFLDVYAAHPGLSAWLVEHFGTAHWPTFNVADSAIVVGAGLLLSTIVFPPCGVGAPATGTDG